MAAKRWSEAEARGVIAEWKQSGKSCRAFAVERSIAVERLYWWKKKLQAAPEKEEPNKRVRSAASFLPVRIVEALSGSLTVKLRCGHAIQLGQGFDEELFSRVVAVLEGT